MGFDTDNFVASLLPQQEAPADGNEPEEQSISPTEEAEPVSEGEVSATGESDSGTSSRPDTTTDERPTDGGGTEQDSQPQQTVPLSVVVQQRQEIAQLKQNLQQLYGELQSVKQQHPTEQQQKQPEVDETFKPTVSYEDDPTRFLLEQNQWLQRQLGNVAQHVYGLYQDGMQKQQQTEQQTRQQTEEQQFRAHVQSLEHQYRAGNQDYDNAVEYLRNRRIFELENQAKLFSRDPRDPNVGRAIRAEVVKEFSNLARAAVQQQVNPAEALYNYAQSIGYKKGEGQQQTQAAVQQPEQNAQYERAQRGQQAAMSVASMPGNAPGTGGDVEDQAPQSFGSLAEALRKEIYKR